MSTGSTCSALQELADVDGDGTPDQIAPDFIDGQGVLFVCLGTGAVLSAPAPPAEAMAVIDLNGDGSAEVAVGPTQIGSGHLSVFSLVDGSLEQVLVDDGEPLVLSEGDDVDPSSGEVSGRWAWGCRDGGDGRRVVLARAEAESWTAQIVAVDGAVATTVSSEGGDAPNGALPTDLFTACT